MSISQKPIFQILVTAFLLLIPLWYNGSPLYYPDSFGYIFWGINMQPPPERAGSYALFIKLFSLGKTVWLNIGFQALATAYVLRLLLKTIAPGYPAALLYFSAFVLAIGSSLGWTAAQLMPDIFCALSSVLLFLFLFHFSYFQLVDKGLVIFLFLYTSTQHVSIFLINGLLLLCLGGWALVTGKWAPLWKRWVVAGALVAGGYLGIGLTHKAMSGEFFISKTSNTFIFSRLAETGILANYLDEHCAKEKSLLCLYRGALPMPGEGFLWGKNSFIHQTGGLHDEKGLYKQVVHGVFSSPKYLFQFGTAAAKSTLKQMCLIEVGNGLCAAYDGFQLRFFGSDYADFRMSKQSQSIDFEKVNTILYLTLIGLVAAFFFTKSNQNLTYPVKTFGLFVLLLLVANALVNGALSTPLHRYQTRVFWLADVWLFAAIFPAIRSYFFPVSHSHS